MNDDAFARRWCGDRSTVEEAALLEERVRSGDLDPERLELAARLGNEAAGADVDQRGGDPARWLEELVRGIDRDICLERGSYDEPPTLKEQTLLRMIIAQLGLLLEQPGMETVLRTFSAAEEYALCPCDDHALAYWKAATDSYPAGQGDGCFSIHPGTMDHGAPGDGCSSGAGCLLGFAEDDVPVDDLVRAMHDEVVPWLLGYGDPVRERQAAAVRPRETDSAEIT